MTLEEKYQYAVDALRAIVKRGKEGSGVWAEDAEEAAREDGYDDGLRSVGYDAEDALRHLGELPESGS